jgi:hypothetical protein
VSIYATIPGLGKPDEGDDPAAGIPLVYQGSHILPSEDDRRGGHIGLAQIPSHITRDGRDDTPTDGRPWPWLRLHLVDWPEDEAPCLLLNPTQARHLAHLLTDWANDADPAGATITPEHHAVHAIRAFAEDMHGWCSPHGVAALYADQLLTALDNALTTPPDTSRPISPAVGDSPNRPAGRAR